MGQLALFARRMRELIGDFLCLSWWDYSETELNEFSRKPDNPEEVLRKCADSLRGRLAVSKIDDDIPDEDAAAIVRVLHDRFGFAESDISESFDPEKFNIVLKHEADHYRNTADAGREFYLTHPDAVIQGITDEGLRDHLMLKSYDEIYDILRACIVSLVVKGDIHAGMMSAASLKEHGFTRPVSFAFAKRIREGENKVTHYYVIKADPVSGRLGFRHFTYEDMLDGHDGEMRKIAEAFGLDGNSREHNPAGTELAVWEDINDIYVIRKTSEHVIPDIDRMFEAFSGVDRKVMSYDEFEAAYGRFRKDMLEKSLFTAAELDEYLRFIEAQFEGKDSLPYSRLQKALDASGKKLDADGVSHRIHCSLYRKLKPYLPELAVMPRSKGKEEEFGLKPLLGSWWFRTPEYRSDDPSAVKRNTVSYFVGSSAALSETVSRGFVIRQISRCSGESVDEEFAAKVMSLMIVDFVRLGQWTVRPFPAKYLREYKDFTDIESEAAKKQSGSGAGASDDLP